MMHLIMDLETLEACQAIMPLARAQQAALEVAYYKLYGELPEWAVVIERVELAGEGLIFVHRDPNEGG